MSGPVDASTERRAVRFGSRDIAFAVERSGRRRTLSIVVERAGVVVKAPTSVDGAAIDAAVRARAPWIVGKLSGFDALAPEPPPRRYVSGESYSFLGRGLRLRVAVGDGARARVHIAGGWLWVTLPADLDGAARAPAVRAALVGWYRARAAEALPPRVDVYAERLGVPPPAVHVAGQDKRWGSCTAAGVLRLNWRVVMAPLALVDYVVAHEVCHLAVRDHSPAFWRLMDRVLPDWAARKARLGVEGPAFRV